jgi:WD40 repeat protein
VIEGAHSHWATSVKYCPDTEKVIATGGGDGRLHLWDRSSAAQDASGDADAHNHAHADADGGASVGARQGRREGDEGPVLSRSGVEGRRFESMYSVAWGRNWRVAGLSYDGRFVVGQVPASIRYGISSQ